MPVKSAQDYLTQYAKDKKITLSEVKNFQNLGFDLNELNKFVADSPDIVYKPKAEIYYKENIPQPTKAEEPVKLPDQTVTYTNPATGETGLSIPEIDSAGKVAVATIAKDAATEVEKARGEWGYKTQGLASEAARAVGFRQAEAAEKATEIESQGRLNLQNIINAGLKDVSEIQGKTERDVTKIGGEYAVKGEETRQSGQRDISRIGANAAVMQGLVNAFSF
jgi:hypothetical protein